jgi:hypothetical protein
MKRSECDKLVDQRKRRFSKNGQTNPSMIKRIRMAWMRNRKTAVVNFDRGAVKRTATI